MKLLALLLLLGCPATGTIGTPYPYGTPGAELHDDAVAMRISNDLFQFARHDLASVLASKFGVDADGYSAIFIPGLANSFVRVKSTELADHVVFMMQKDGLRLQVNNLSADLHVNLGALAPCIGKGPVTMTALDITMTPKIGRDPFGQLKFEGTTTVNAAEFGAIHLRASDIVQTATLSTACQDMDNTLQGLSGALGILSPLLNAVLPTFATAIGNALLGLLWTTDLEIHPQIPVSTLPWVPAENGRNLAMALTTSEHAFAVSQLGAGQADPTLGINLPMAMGAYSERSTCVDPTPMPSIDPKLVAPKLDGLMTLTDPDTGATSDQPYHLGVMISEQYLNTLAYALRNSGILCSAVGSEAGGLLQKTNLVPTAGLLFWMAPELQRLAKPDAPIFFRTIPGDNPTVTFGTGKLTGTDANGMRVKESLVTVHLPSAKIEFDTVAWDRYVRAFSLTMDLSIGVSLVATTKGKLMVTIDHIGVDRMRDIDNPLLIQGYEFTHLAEVLFTLITNMLGGGLLTFDVPLQQTLQSALGGSLIARVIDIRAEGEGNHFLGAYFKMCSTGHNDPSDQTCFVPQSVAARDTPSLNAAQHHVDEGVVALKMDAQPGYEYQAAVDSDVFGAFSSPSKDGLFRVSNPLLRVLGKHTLNLRARLAGAPLDLAAPVTSIEVQVDAPIIKPQAAPLSSAEVLAPKGGCNASAAAPSLLLLSVTGLLLQRAFGRPRRRGYRA